MVERSFGNYSECGARDLTDLCGGSRAYPFRSQCSGRSQSAATAKRMSSGMFREPVFRMIAARWFSTVR